MSDAPTVSPTARWGDARCAVYRPIALALDGDVAVVLELRGELTRTRWSLADGALRSRAALGPWAQGASAALSPDGARAVRFLPGGRVAVWDDDLRPPREFALPETPRAAAFAPDGGRLAVWRSALLRSVNGAVALDVIDLTRGAVEASLQGCNHVAWSPDGASIVTHRDGLRRWSPHAGEGPSLDPSAAHGLALVTHDRAARLRWTGELELVRLGADRAAVEVSFGHPPAHPDVRQLVHADVRGAVVTTSAGRGRGTVVWSLTFHDGRWRRLGTVAFEGALVASDGARVVAVDRNALVAWALPDGAPSRWSGGFGDRVAAVAARGRRVAAHDGAGDLRVFDAGDLAEAWALAPATARRQSHPGAICFGHDARSLYTVTERDGLVRWDLATGAIAATGPRVRSAPERLVLAPDDRAALALFRTWPGDREPAVRRLDLRGEPSWDGSLRARAGPCPCLDVRVAAETTTVLWNHPAAREAFATASGEWIRHLGSLGGSGRRGALGADGAAAFVTGAEGDEDARLTWVSTEGRPAQLGVASLDALLLFAGAHLVVCDGDDWGLWRHAGGNVIERAAHLDGGGCLASALAYDDATGVLAVGTAEGTLVTFALGAA